jgi:hypothetical protein
MMLACARWYPEAGANVWGGCDSISEVRVLNPYFYTGVAS